MSGDRQSSGQPSTPQHSEQQEPSDGNNQTHDISTSDPPNASSSPTTAPATTNAGIPGDSNQRLADNAHELEVPVIPVTTSNDASQQREIDYGILDDARPTRYGEVYHGDSTWSISTSALMPNGIVQAHGDTYSRTPNNNPQVNGEGDIRDRRAGMLNNTSHNQPNWTHEESRALARAFHSQNIEPSVSISEFTTYSPDGWNLFHNDSSGNPLATTVENPALLSAPPVNHFNPQPDHRNRTPFNNSPPGTHTVTNSTSEEESPAVLSDYLPQMDPATQEQHEVAWTAASSPMRRRDTLLPTRVIESGNAEARGGLGNIPLVGVGSLPPGTSTRETNGVFERFPQYPGDEASSAAPGEDPIGRRRITPLANSDPTSPGTTDGGVRSHNRRAPRPVPSIPRTTSAENRTFWAESSDPENDNGSN